MMRRTGALFLLFVGGCSSSSNSHSAPLPSAAEIQAFTRVSNVFVVSADVDGTTGLLGVDTGDPFVLLNPATFPLAPAVGSVKTLTIAAQNFADVPVITSSESPTSPDALVPLGGLLGCPILCQSVATFNYRDVIFTLGSPPSTSGLLPETQVAFMFEGGGTSAEIDGTSVSVPQSRVVVTVDIEGASYRMIVDTGASEVTVDSATYTALTSDGRAQRTAGGVETTSGMSTASYTRTKTVAVGGAQVAGVIVAHDTSFDGNLATLSAEAGETINGSLGGTYLENFNLTIDYPNRELHLAPYADTSFIFDPAELVGFSLAESNGGYSISGVLTGSDAETKGARAGDAIVAIDGEPLAGLTTTEATVLLGGKVGTTKSVQFGAAQLLANQTVDIAVSELLPLPP